MRPKTYHVVLSAEQRAELTTFCHSYRHSERERKHARVLLLADEGPFNEGPFNEGQESGPKTDKQIAAQVNVSLPMVGNVRQRFVLRGLEFTVHRKEQDKRKERLLDGDGEAYLIALVCSAPPDGHNRWGLHLLKDALIEQRIVDTISHEAVRQTLKKMNLPQ